MNWEGVVSGPTATLASGIAGAVVAQLSYWLHVHHQVRTERDADAVALAIARLSHEETANERLIRTIDERLKLSEQRYDDCQRIRRELDARMNRLGGTVIRLSAALDIMRSGYAAAGLKEPPLPDLPADMTGGVEPRDGGLASA
jgi:hypothetical protein